MLAWTFYAQPLGCLTAGVISISVLASHRGAIPMVLRDSTCDQQCRQALDRSWRSIIGVRVIFAIIAFYFRRTIPESPRYTADVLGRPKEAIGDADLFMVIASRHPPLSPPPIQALVYQSGPALGQTLPPDSAKALQSLVTS